VTIQLPDKSAIQVTNFAYYLPNGESVEGVGLEPDYVVEIPKKAAGKPISSMTREEDTQLSRRSSYSCLKDNMMVIRWHF